MVLLPLADTVSSGESLVSVLVVYEQKVWDGECLIHRLPVCGNDMTGFGDVVKHAWRSSLTESLLYQYELGNKTLWHGLSWGV